MSAGEYPCIFPLQMEGIVCIDQDRTRYFPKDESALTEKKKKKFKDVS